MAKDKDAKIGDPAFPNLTEADVDRIAERLAQKMTGAGPKASTEAADRVAPPKGTKVVVRRTTSGEFGYHGRTLDRNQVFELLHLDGNGARDAQLVALGYISVLPSDAHLETCGKCGAQFTDPASASAHYTRRHQPVERVPQMEPRLPGETLQEYEARESAWRAQILAEEEAREQRMERDEDRLAPLYLDQTKASRA